MSEFAQIIQEQLLQEVGNNVKIFLKGGQEIFGTVADVRETYVIVRKANGRSTPLAIELISGVDSVDGELPVARAETTEVPPPPKSVALTSTYVPQEIHTPVPTTVQSNGIDPEVQARLIKIDAFFSGKIAGSKIEVQAPDFLVPQEELKGQKPKEGIAAWDRIRQRYEYAARINELGSKYGRMQPIINELRSLIEKHATSSSLKRHLAYFLYLAGNIPEALKTYKETGALSHTAHDWYNTAALAVELNQAALGCYALEQVLSRVPSRANKRHGTCT